MVAPVSKKVSGKVEDRDRILRLLVALGAELPELMKLVTPALEAKLNTALDYAQLINAIEDQMPLVPTDLPVWNVRPVVHILCC